VSNKARDDPLYAEPSTRPKVTLFYSCGTVPSPKEDVDGVAADGDDDADDYDVVVVVVVVVVRNRIRHSLLCAWSGGRMSKAIVLRTNSISLRQP
jgi:hypothetical protein